MANHQDTDLDYEDLNKRQRLKAALYHGIKQISKEVEQEMEMRISSQVLATLCESLTYQTEVYAVDLELFAKHGKRTNVSVDDVKLLARRNQELLGHLNNIATEHTSEKEATRKPRKGKVKDSDKQGSKKGKKTEGSASRMDTEEDV